MPRKIPSLPPLPVRPKPGTLILAPIHRVSLGAPLQWLALGWRDLWRCGLPSLMHGMVLAVFGALLLVFCSSRFWLLAGAFSGFLIVAPVLATSLYALSRELERGQPASWRTIVLTWTRWQHSRFAAYGGYWSLVRFGLLLSLAGTGWVLTSAALITALSEQPINTPIDFLQHIVLTPENHLFELWLIVGALLAAPLFASSVVAMPLLLDRRADVLKAVLISWQTVLDNPAAMALWATLLMGLTLLGMLSVLGLAIILPWLGHASWHAYRSLVDASVLPERLAPEAGVA